MPYSKEHKEKIRKRILSSARTLFNERGFAQVSIDEIMAAAGLTRGGFYNHFPNKEALFVEALIQFAENRENNAQMAQASAPEVARSIFQHYVSREHLDDIGQQCPLMALPSDVYRAGPEVQSAYERVLNALISVFEGNMRIHRDLPPRETGLATAAMCVGAMVLARSVDDRALADEIIDATMAYASTATSLG
ncbi:MAG: TetR/AcrR family transcriptional regulator [Gammaproteobacteria bacterium]|jgi:TetR/AcrR family transcriptional regulator, transcriptional repressor for nem operon|nr:TetR/AcrR family transcriptional regulator [Gammaproteobacteria bacterium]MBT4495103.1 TetR/AcrR family transcriptional regulator [Gammaproteobacteria bacterium]MBT7370989.1 TetR/AcrR family transcriptional regulator [Gammaproteobacteria bacterium]